MHVSRDPRDSCDSCNLSLSSLVSRLASRIPYNRITDMLQIVPSLSSALKSGPSSAKGSSSAKVATALAHVGSYKDIYLHSMDGEADGSEKKLFGESKEAMRKAVVVHALNHVLK